MKIIVIANDAKGMAIRFLSQEIRLMRPGCNILVAHYAILNRLPEVDYLFVTRLDSETEESYFTSLGGKIYQLKSDGNCMRAYHAEVMTLLPEILDE